MKKTLLYILAIVAFAFTANAQAPNSFNYQSVVRDASGNLLVNTNVGLQISILQGSASGNSVYVETFNLTTNGYALVNSKIGTGTPSSGDFSTIDWAAGNYYVEVAMDFSGGTNYTVMGTSQLISVPYALHAKTSDDAFSGDYSDLANAPTNVSDFTNDAGYLDTELDGDPTNEIQTLSLSNDTVYLSNGGNIVLPAGFDGQYSSLTGAPTNVSAFTNDAGYLITEVDGDVTNELQTISKSGNTVTLSNSGGSFTDEVDDADNDPINELQNLSLVGDSLEISNGNKVEISGLNYWQKNDDSLRYFNPVGVNADPWNCMFHVYNDSRIGPDDDVYAVFASAMGKSPNNWQNAAILAAMNTDSADSRGVSVSVAGLNGGYGVRSESQTDQWNEAISGVALSEPGNTDYQIGVRGEARKGWSAASSGTGTHVGGDFSATGDGTWNVGAQGYANTMGTGNNRGLEGSATSNTSSNNMGVGGFAIGTITGVSRGVYGQAANGNGINYGIHGFAAGSSTNSSTGVYGYANGSTPYNTGVDGTTEATGATNIGTGGYAYGTVSGSNKNYGVYGYAQNADTNYGVYSTVTGADNVNYGMYSEVNSGTVSNYAVYAKNNSTTGNTYGVYGIVDGISTTVNWGITGISRGSSLQNTAVSAYTNGTGTWNLGIQADANGSGTNNYGVYSSASNGTNNYAGYFIGDVTITGNLNVTGSIAKGGGTFKIDHPQDPENKYLVHSFMESPDMMNVYSGNVVTDVNGYATVSLPNYFEAANKDYRYQLTVIGTFAQAIVLEEIADNKFKIQTNQPNVKVSWQVSGVRADKYANAHRVVPELEKTKKGTYLHPELYGASKEQSENAEHLNIATQNGETRGSSTGNKNVDKVLEDKKKSNEVNQVPRTESTEKQGERK